MLGEACAPGSVEDFFGSALSRLRGARGAGSRGAWDSRRTAGMIMTMTAHLGVIH